MTAPDSASGVVCDVAGLVTIVSDLLTQRRDGAGAQLYDRARDRGLTLAAPALAVVKAATLYLDPRGRKLLAAFVVPEHGNGARGVWWVVDAHPSELADYPDLLARCGDPVTAYVAAYALAVGWPVATDNEATYQAFGLATVGMPPLPS